MNDFNNDDLGEQIRKSVASSTNWVNQLIDEIHAGVNDQVSRNRPGSPSYQQAMEERARIQAERQRQIQERTRIKNEMNSRFGKINKPAVWFWYLAAFGSLNALWDELTPFSSIIDVLLMGLLSVFFGYLAVNGTRKRRQAKRFEKYVNRIGQQEYVEIDDLANNLGYSRKTVMKDIKAMISQGILKQGHISEDGKYLMITNTVYNDYQNTMNSYNARAEVERMKQEEEAARVREANGGRDPELVAALEEGRTNIRKIREANDKIPGEEITKKLDRLEQNCKTIFTAVELHPEKLGEIRKFMDYYMPTTLKLVNSYYEFDSQPVQGENIMNAKREIEDTMDMINMAYENLADRLYEADTMDVSADISVLKTMFAQEGLNNKDFK